MPDSANYWQKDLSPQNFAADLSWNFPEQRAKTLTILGGNSQNFSTEVKLAEFINHNYPFLQEVKNLFPASLKSKFPPLPNLDFFDATNSGSFKPSPELRASLANADFALFSGDFSKNSETAIALAETLKNSPSTPVLLTRDTIDLLSPEADAFIERENCALVASLAQLQKLFRALYYPKMLLLSSPLFPVIETLHKFTLTYPVALLTFHDGQILAAKNGAVRSVPLAKTTYSPLTLWSGEVAARAAVFSLFNPSKPLDSLLAALSTK
ncbi:hypothetical protein IJI17_02300 [Candidatus Saccharibacteria bacterium]|nr:hypothetical protein [Candidatus Saccharibacteria bacterium]